MEQRRKSRILGKIKFALRFFYISLIYVLLLIIINFYATWSIIKELESALQYSSGWKVNFIISQLSLIGVVVILFITMMIIIHRSLGPMPRMEKILEKVIQGDYTQRIFIRKKDFIRSFADKLNKVLELLEKKSKT